MSEYYTAVMFLCVFSMIIMQFCLSISNTLTKNKKMLLRLLYLTIIISAFCEWFGIYLQGTGGSTRVLHILTKAIELSVAPSIGFLLAYVIDVKRIKGPVVFLVVNAVLEGLSGVFGFIYRVDGSSNYTHGQFYWIYISAYMISILYCMYAFIKAMRKYQFSGLVFFIPIIIFMFSGIAIQLFNSDLKIDYITLAMASIMVYVFTIEMIQQTDELTGMINRRGYENYIAHIEEKCAVIFFDIDRFKFINDRYGHYFGDVCLKAIGQTVRANYSKYGKCFRIGGDEFCVILTKRLDQVDMINTQFFNRMDQLRTDEQRMPYISVGYVFFDPQTDNITDAVMEADKMMYKFKAEHRENMQSR